MLEVSKLGVKKSGTKILEDISFVCKSPEFIGVIGPNGAGKTTLLRSLAGLEPHTGLVALNGAHLNPDLFATSIAWVPHQQIVSFDYPVIEIVLMGRFPWHRGHPRTVDKERSMEALKTVGMDLFVDRTITSLSAGELQKVMLARAIAGDSPLLILDEPLANLDLSASFHLCATLKDLVTQGRTVIASMHDLSHAAKFADRLICLNQGEMFGMGTPKSLLTPETLRDAFRVEGAWKDAHLVIDRAITFENL
jgi:iron complex transport system ATP-binding protein